jgi:hypothetical protein
MKTVTLFLMLFLVGCASDRIPVESLLIANKHCEDKSGLSDIRASGSHTYEYNTYIEYNIAGICGDGSQFTLKKFVRK